MRSRAIALAGALLLAPLVAKAADLVVWWRRAGIPRRTRRDAELYAAFQDQTGTRIELLRIRGGDRKSERRSKPGSRLFSCGAWGASRTSLTSGPTRVGS
jgi:hypothetical protein